MSSKAEFEAKRGDVWAFDPEKLIIVEDSKHELYDERIHLPLNDRMIQSIVARGVLKPILFQRDGENALVVDGRQRVRHAREANKRLRAEGREPVRILGIQFRGKQEDVQGSAYTVNEYHQADSTLARARKAGTLAAKNYTSEEIAGIFNVAITTVKMWEALLNCDKKVQSAVEAGKITATDAALKIAKIPREEQIRALEELLATMEVSGAKPDSVEIAEAVARRGGRVRVAQSHVSKPQLKRLYQNSLTSAVLDERSRTLLGWIIGETSDAAVERQFDGILDALCKPKKEKKERLSKPLKAPKSPKPPKAPKAPKAKKVKKEKAA